LGLKFLTVALDRKIFAHLDGKPDFIVTLVTSPEDMDLEKKSFSFRTPQFNQISRRKMEAAYSGLLQGYNVLYIDIDIALISDPIPYMVWDNVDYSFSTNMPCPG